MPDRAIRVDLPRCVSVIIPDEVVAGAPADYLADLYAKLRKIDEFELVAVRIDFVPDSPKVQEFCNRFLNGWKACFVCRHGTDAQERAHHAALGNKNWRPNDSHLRADRTVRPALRQ